MTTSPHDIRQVFLEVLPDQGEVSEDDYLWLTDRSNRLIEFTDGFIEVLPMPTDDHQVILKILIRLFDGVVEPLGGIVLFAPLRLRPREGKIREPDLMLLLDARDSRRQRRHWTGADLVLEVVSEDDPRRDLVTKRREYEETGIPEYWMVNPFSKTITILTLQDGAYVEHGIFGRGTRATSVLLPEFLVEMDVIFVAI